MEVQKTTAINLGDLLDSGEGAGVTLVAGDTQLVAHRAVLAARSPVFAAMFGHDTVEASSGLVAIPDVEGPVLRQLLAYLYTLQAPQLPGMAPQLLVAADKYGLSQLKADCERQVAAQLCVENAAAAAVLALRHSCSSLRQATVAFIKAHTHQVMATQGWTEAVRVHPEDVVELSRLLAEAPAEPSATAAGGSKPTAVAHPHPQSSTRGAGATARAPCHNPAPDADAVSPLRSLSAYQRGERLIQAAQAGAVDGVRTLLAAGADVGVTSEDKWTNAGLMKGNKWTPLHWAAMEGHAEVVRCLLGSRAKVDAQDSSWNTALHLAALKGHAAVVQVLAASSADPNAMNYSGRTPLHLAALNGHAQVAAMLLNAGAYRGARDNERKTPLDLARQNNKQQLVQMLS